MTGTHDTDALLLERQKTHGKFRTNARISQDLKTTVWQYTNGLTVVQTEALEQICNKIARILNGGQDHLDSWQDIQGYSQLALNELNGVDV